VVCQDFAVPTFLRRSVRVKWLSNLPLCLRTVVRLLCVTLTVSWRDALTYARYAGHALITTGLQAGDSGLEIDISRFNGLPSRPMSVHSYSRCWIHLIWGTLNREKLLNKEVQPASPVTLLNTPTPRAFT